MPTRTLLGDLSGPCPRMRPSLLMLALGFPAMCLGDFDFAPGSNHVISGVSPQMDQYGSWWVFSQWSNGLGANGVYTTDNNPATPDTLTADFLQGAQVSFVTNPTGLQLNVDGRQNWPSLNFIWGIGTTHTVSAPASEAGSNGPAIHVSGLVQWGRRFAERNDRPNGCEQRPAPDRELQRSEPRGGPEFAAGSNLSNRRNQLSNAVYDRSPERRSGPSDCSGSDPDGRRRPSEF